MHRIIIFVFMHSVACYAVAFLSFQMSNKIAFNNLKLNHYWFMFNTFSKLDWPDFKFINNFTGTKTCVPETFRISPILAPKVRKILKQPFLVYIYIAHTVLFTRLKIMSQTKHKETGATM